MGERLKQAGESVAAAAEGLFAGAASTTTTTTTATAAGRSGVTAGVPGAAAAAPRQALVKTERHESGPGYEIHEHAEKRA